jgi:hypothetical protein
VPNPRGDAGDILKAADDALYTSKREGRNRTTLLQVNWPAPAPAHTLSMPSYTTQSRPTATDLDLGATGTLGGR